MIYEDLGYDFGIQALTLLYALGAGALLGVLFDFFRISRVFLSVPASGRAARMLSEAVLTAVSFIEDIIFFTVSACTVVLFLHSTNRGIGRGYLLFGTGVGFILYLATLGQLTKLFFAAVSRMLWRMLGFINSKMICPVLRFVGWLGTWIYKNTLGRSVSFILAAVGRISTDRAMRDVCLSICPTENNKKGTKDETASFFGTRKIYNSSLIRNTDISSGVGAGGVQRP